VPRKRQPREIWTLTRRRVLERDGWRCTHCAGPVTEETAHIDHRQSGKRGTNEMSNLRSLCRRCRHRGMIASALRDGVIPANWRQLVWDDPPT